MHWIRRHLDPDEILTLIIAGAWIYAGVSTWHDLIGHPRDAPHLRIPGQIRASMWIGTAVLSLVALRLSRVCGLRRFSAIALGLTPTVRLASYLFSWVASWPIVDAVLDDRAIVGDPRAWGSLWIYVALDALVLARVLAPWSWRYLDEIPTRRGRMERAGRAVRR